MLVVDGGEVYENETRARRRIRKALEAKGYTVKSIDWEPVHGRHGPTGGWFIDIGSATDPTYHNVLAGLNMGDVMWWIDMLEDARGEGKNP